MSKFFEDEKLETNELRMCRDRRVKVVLVAFCLIFALGFIVFGYLWSETSLSSSKYANTLEGSYKRSFYELLDNVNNIDTNLAKVEVSGNKALQKKYLQLVSDNCKYAQSNFSLLPISMNVVDDGVKFINQMDGYCTSLISADNLLNEEQKDKIQELRDIILELKSQLNLIVSKLLQGYSILDNNIPDEEGLTDFSVNFDGISSDSISYPSMIFDGPFSDSLYNKEILGLGESEVDKTTAQSILENILAGFNVQAIDYAGEATGNFVTYDYEIRTGTNTYFAQVTKREGKLLTLSSYINESESMEIDENECKNKALEFVGVQGISNMQVVWSEASKGTCFINLAPVINGIIYYPDLIKVKVDMNTGLVVGYEAQSYYYNHVERQNLQVSIGATEARDLLDLTLNINSQKLCIMPLEYGGEVLAYEFECEYYGETYYVYINALNGKEERVLKIVNTDEGELTE